MSHESIRKCSKCNVEYNQDFGPSYPFEVAKQRRILIKNGKHFCFNCLASEHNVNCQYCHKRINSKDELAYWGGGVISINGDYDYAKADDRVFTCWGCDEKIREKVKNGVKPSWHSGWGPILFPEHNIRKCRIAGCSQKPYYECMDLCLSHSKPCKGGKIKSDGKRCSVAMGSDEGDICEFCKNQTETYQQKNDGLKNESEQEFEKYEQAHQKAQNWWNTLSSSKREKELARVVENMKLGKYWANNVKEKTGSGWACDGSFWEIKNGKFVSSCSHLVPIQIAEEFEKEMFGNVSGVGSIRSQVIRKDNNDTNSDSKIIVKTIKFENKESSSKSNSTNSVENSPNKVINETLIINLKSVKKITLSGNNLVIKFKSSEMNNNKLITQNITAEQINNNQELQAVKNYCQKNNKTSLNQQELNSLINPNSTSFTKEPKKNNLPLLIGSGIVVLVIIGLVVVLVIRKTAKIKKRS